MAIALFVCFVALLRAFTTSSMQQSLMIMLLSSIIFCFITVFYHLEVNIANTQIRPQFWLGFLGFNLVQGLGVYITHYPPFESARLRRMCSTFYHRLFHGAQILLSCVHDYRKPLIWTTIIICHISLVIGIYNMIKLITEFRDLTTHYLQNLSSTVELFRTENSFGMSSQELWLKEIVHDNWNDRNGRMG